MAFGGLETCPDLKGIKAYSCVYLHVNSGLETCPDLKGIKTLPLRVFDPRIGGLETCPDLKGIKTRRVAPARALPV